MVPLMTMLKYLPVFQEWLYKTLNMSSNPINNATSLSHVLLKIHYKHPDMTS